MERNRAGGLGGGPGGVVRFRCTFHNTIFDVLRARGWREVESETDWDVAWIDVGWLRENFDSMHMEPHQRLNHFRNHYELTRKDNLIKNLKRTQRQLQREGKEEEARKYEFFPGTYVLPADYGLFVEEFKQQQGAIWIMKPIGKAQGKGIFLFNKLAQVCACVHATHVQHVHVHVHGVPPLMCIACPSADQRLEEGPQVEVRQPAGGDVRRPALH